ncbi:tRNA (guanosine(37)-N1)-methyltransferase TrmD, partial [Helicobacter pylori]|nr:tRNA (guanosine(37)-N1)-methyltransferase TrmD [Helicobacter pylori]
MKFSVLTLFPQLVWPYFEDSILKRALEKNLF